MGKRKIIFVVIYLFLSYILLPNVNAEGYSIALLHRFYESGFGEEPITEEQVVSLGYNTYIFGHDHRPYQTKVISDTIKVIRPGSLARNSSDQYNRIRKPRILVFDTETLSFYYEEVRSEAGQDVFFENVGIHFLCTKILVVLRQNQKIIITMVWEIDIVVKDVQERPVCK